MLAINILVLCTRMGPSTAQNKTAQHCSRSAGLDVSLQPRSIFLPPRWGRGELSVYQIIYNCNQLSREREENKNGKSAEQHCLRSLTGTLFLTVTAIIYPTLI